MTNAIPEWTIGTKISYDEELPSVYKEFMIFEDPTGRRSRISIALFWTAALSAGCAIGIMTIGATVPPSLPNLPHSSADRLVVQPDTHLLPETAAAATDEDFLAERSASNERREFFRVRKGDGPEGSYFFEHVGSPIPEKTFVLTFDDGPDPDWTPTVLDILDEYDIHAVFFVTGAQAVRHPDMLREIIERGHIIGNHTYNHPDIFQISSTRLQWELNTTQRAIEHAIGRKTLLFRSPYFILTTIDDTQQFPALEQISSNGYIISGANIDSRDWEEKDISGIYKNMQNDLEREGNHVILYHDSGGDRQPTIDSLRWLIPEMLSRGYSFEGLDEALRIPSEHLMPEVSGFEQPLAFITSSVIGASDTAWRIIKWLFFFTTAIATLRIGIIGTLVVFSLFKKKPILQGTVHKDQLVSVIIPAHNEEATIGNTLRSLLRSSHAALEILVIDDGSTDATATIVQAIAAQDGRIHLVQKENGGKATALNWGFHRSTADIVVTIDADTHVKHRTVEALLEPFDDPSVTAACGNVEVGNVQNLITGFQSLEYITTQNFDRRAFDALNCISVVPGATSAWRKNVVIEAGGFTGDTLAEDADLTLTLLENGGRITYVPEARSLTEAPLTFSGFMKQRFRWVYGTMQCLWKHSGSFFHGTLGWVALPNILLFQVVFPLLAPIGDLALFFSLLKQEIPDMVVWYCMFIYIDLVGSLLAFTLEKKPKRLMLLILLQRFCYRQVMYTILFRSISAMVRGNSCLWNRVQRTGTIVPEPA